jgi:uncharacterized protein
MQEDYFTPLLHGYQDVYNFMKQCLHNDIYEIAHAQRVVCNSLRILDGEKNADAHVVILAALLHDIGWGEDTEDHAVAGSKTAYAFLRAGGYPDRVAAHVRDCILTHRYKTTARPESNEAKIVFDADKLDLMGAVGAARAIEHAVREGEPFYAVQADGLPGSGKKGEPPSLLREYRKKLRKLPDILFMPTSRVLAAQIRRAQKTFFADLAREADLTYAEGARLLALHAASVPPPPAFD